MNEDKKVKYIDGIDEEFQDIALKLKNMDFSQESNKKSVFDKVLKNKEKSGSMKKSNKLKKFGMAAAFMVIASTIIVMQNSSANKVFAEIINKVSLGHITVIQDNISKEDTKLYDKDGNELCADKIKKGGTFYTKNGESIKIEAKDKEDDDSNMLLVTDSNKINNYTCFKVILPSYLPEGYKFKQAEFTKDSNGNVKDSKYADLKFVNSKTGEKFYIQERLDCEETKFEMATDGKVEKIKINGVDAILNNNRNIDWINNGTIYSLMGSKLGRAEVIKIAESMN